MKKATDELGLPLRAAQFAAHRHNDQRCRDAKATPCINHPIALAEVLYTDRGVRASQVIAAGPLHDTIDKSESTYGELRCHLGETVATRSSS